MPKKTKARKAVKKFLKKPAVATADPAVLRLLARIADSQERIAVYMSELTALKYRHQDRYEAELKRQADKDEKLLQHMQASVSNQVHGIKVVKEMSDAVTDEPWKKLGGDSGGSQT